MAASTAVPVSRAAVQPACRFDIERALAGIDSMAAQRPVAAQLVQVTNSDETDAKRLSRILAADVALAGRVLKLANSAFFGMRGRVTSLQFAVTVVGFTTVRTMATVALTDLDDESRLPEDFWKVTTSVALVASTLAPRFGERAPEALCIGLLAQLGAALLHQNDPAGYAELCGREPTFRGRRSAEQRRYGIHALRLTAMALEQWGFPAPFVCSLQRADDLASLEGGLVRAAFEVAARLTQEEHEAVPIAQLTCGQLGEEALEPLLRQVRSKAEELRQDLLG